MKYINADRLKAEINRLYKEHSCREYCDEACLVLDSMDDFIDSLQQEQPELSPEELDKLVAEEFASHSRASEYGWEVTYNRAELYQLFKRMALAFGVRKED